MTHIPGHLAGESIAEMTARYAAVGRKLPSHYDETVAGQVTVSVPATGQQFGTFLEPEGLHRVFDPVSRQPVSLQLSAAVNATAPPGAISPASMGVIGAVGELLEGDIAGAAGAAAVPALISGIGAAIPALAGVATVALAGWGIYELASAVFGGGEGFPGVPGAAAAAGALTAGTQEGSGMTMTPFGGQFGIRGPGVPEPAPGTVAKQWSVVVHSREHGTFRIFYFRMFTGEILMYNPAKREWKKWRPKKPLAVMYRGKTTLSQAIKVQSYLDKMWRKVAKKTKAIKMA